MLAIPYLHNCLLPHLDALVAALILTPPLSRAFSTRPFLSSSGQFPYPILLFSPACFVAACTFRLATVRGPPPLVARWLSPVLPILVLFPYPRLIIPRF